MTQTAATSPQRVGLWLDDPAAAVLSTTYLDGLKDLQLDVVAVMVNEQVTSDGPEWTWTGEQLKQLRQALGAELVLTGWPVADKAFIDEFCEGASDRINTSGATGFEVDTEQNWRQKGAKNTFSTWQEAGTYLAEQMRTALPAPGSLQLTTFPDHPELSSDSTVAKYMDIVIPQAYSTNPNDRGIHIHWDNPLGPIQMQQLGIGNARKTGRPVACGLAAYDQGFAGHTDVEAMQAALTEAVVLGCSEVRYWSSKWAVGSVKNDYSADFISKVSRA